VQHFAPLEGILRGVKSMPKQSQIEVQGVPISVLHLNGKHFLSLTNMIKAKNGEYFVADWLRNRNTIEFLGIWERIHNETFNYGEFDVIKSQVGLNRFRISAKEWILRTNAIGLRATAGRYGGTFAHQDIAFEFGMWISPEFKIYLIKEFQRLKQQESEQESFKWSVNRTLSKLNYHIHTDAIKAFIIPSIVTPAQIANTYATEADLLNVALFGHTAKQWRSVHPKSSGNIRDQASIEQLLVLSNLESMNAEFIRMRMPQSERILRLNEIAIYQMRILALHNQTKSFNSLK